MKSYSLSFICIAALMLLGCTNEVDPLPNASWEMTFGSIGEDFGVDVKTNSLGEIVILGKSENLASDSSFARLIKLSTEGQLLMDLHLSHDKHFEPYDFMIDSSDKITVIGGTQKDGILVPYAFQISESGDIIVDKELYLASGDMPVTIIQSSDNGYLLSGTVETSDQLSVGSTILSKFDESLNEVWAVDLTAFNSKSKVIGLENNEFGDHFVLVTFFSPGTDFSYTGWYVFSKDFEKKALGTYFTEGILNNPAVSILSPSQNINYVVSRNEIPVQNVYNTSVAVIENLLKETSYMIMEDFSACSSIQTPNRGLLIVGNQNSSKDLVVKKITSTLAIDWEKTYGGKNRDSGAAIAQSGDYYYVVGSTESYGKGLNDIWVLKIDASGNL
jgi:hypothetical protein